MDLQNVPEAIPIACTLTPDGRHCQADELLPALVLSAQRWQWTEEGLRLWFLPTSEHLTAITRTIDQERACCAFLYFRLSIPQAGAEFVFEVTGPKGTRDFLGQLGISRHV